ncbi:ABC transporter ATP-binding protein [Marisediminicola sp. LYQ134]|uniref:ABC transporter ATP-binding protein n=1 Tax=Marisediminicola sp. LYQ134 TaxID=3391061 RepID=UPI003983D084
MTNAIDIRSISRRFGRTTALDDVSFTVPQGSICGLLGRNGAGKTTIMSIIAGQDRPTSGSVEVLGHAPFEHGPTLENISYVRDNQRYPDDYRLRHVLRIAPHFAPHWSDEVAGSLLDTLRIPEKTAIKKFSRGQLSAVAIVLGLASRAPVTLLDEPYLGLDVTARGIFYDALLRDLDEHPRTVLLSTHLIEESENLLDRVVIIDRGKVVVESAYDESHRLAVQVSGVTEAVERFAATRTVLRTQRVGGLASVTVAGAVDAVMRDDADHLGVQLAPASLSEIVAAYGANDAAPTESRTGVSA